MTSFDVRTWRRPSTLTDEGVTVGETGDPFDDGLAELAPPNPVHARVPRRSVNFSLRTTGPIVLFVAWWYASRVGWLNPHILAGPGAVWSTFTKMVADGTLWSNLSASLSLAFTGLAIGAACGITLGVLTGFTRLGDQLVDPVLQMVRTIPFLALLPLFIVWFGIGEEPKVILIAVASAFPLYLNTHGGVRDVDPKIVEASRVYGVSRLRSVWEIVLPGALPSLLIGIRIALGVSLLALIFAEQINTTKGIGYLLFTAQAYFQTNIMVVCVVIYAVWGLVADLAVRLLQRVLMPWQHATRLTRQVTVR
jgi:sulfonate transport system permease protein